MWGYLLKRFLETVPVILLTVTLAFFLLRLAPGNPFESEKGISEQVRAALDEQYGFDQPLHWQYLTYMGDVFFRLDLGPSLKYQGWRVSELIASKAVISLELGAYALVIALAVGLCAGVLAAWRPHTLTDRAPMAVALLGISLPAFVLGPLFIWLFALKWELFNVSGWFLPRDRILPAITLGIVYSAIIARLARTSMMEVRHQDYMRTAKAKGLSEVRVYLVHGLRNGLTPVVSYLGPAMAGLITGSFAVETIFNIPGLGRFFVASALNRDDFMVIGTVLFFAVTLILFNLFVDIALVVLNPRRQFD